MPVSLFVSWISEKFARKIHTEVAPIQIIVQPRQQERSPVRESQEQNRISVFAVEDELRYARLWYSNDNDSVTAAAVLSDRRPGEDARESVEMSEIPSGLSLVEQSMAATNAISTAATNHSRLQLGNTVSIQNRSNRNCVQKFLDHVNNFKRYVSKRKTQPQSYLHSYLDIMYLLCISGVRVTTIQEDNAIGLRKWCRWIGSKLQLGVFALFAFLSAFQSFCQAKYDVLWFLYEGGLNQFIKFSFNVISLFTSVYCSYLFCYKWNTVEKMATAMSSYERNLHAFTKTRVLCVSLATISALLATFMSLFIGDYMEFSIVDVMLGSSVQMSEDLFLWSPQNLNVSAQRLDDEFGIELNSTEITLAVVKMFRDLAYYLQDGMFWDLIVCVVFTLFCWMKLFMENVKEVVENVVDRTSEEWRVLQQKRELVWRMYRNIRVVFEAVNNVFDLLLIFFHASNVLRFAFFMENLIYPGNIRSFAYVHLLYNIVKSEITYMVASRIALQNKVIRKWLRNWGSQTGKVDVGYTEIDMNAVLDELDEEPLGLGTGDLMIDQGFHFGLLGLVSSLFVMLASKKH